MAKDKSQIYRNPEDLSDSNEEVHPNIDSKSFHRYRREQERARLEELRSKKNLTEEEKKEKDILEYKARPVAVEKEESSFKIAEEKKEPVDYSDEMIWMLNNPKIDDIIGYLKYRNVEMNELIDLIYLNLRNAIHDGDDDFGEAFCRLGLLMRWVDDFGLNYLHRFKKMDPVKFDEMIKSHYITSKKAILSLKEVDSMHEEN